ncbi:MAG: hypothetical protein ACR2L2_04740 [Acidobacteriota bacterium]
MIHGELGSIAMGRSPGEPLVITVQEGDGSKQLVPEILPASPVGDPYAHFVRSIRDGVEPLVTGDDGRESLAIALASYESARAGKVIRLR